MLQMRITLCARFAIFLAILLTNTDALNMTDETAQAKATEEPDNTATTQTALTSLLKDTKNVKRQDFLLHHDLDDIAGGRELYLQSRSEWLEFFALLQILDSPAEKIFADLFSREHLPKLYVQLRQIVRILRYDPDL